MLDLMLIAVLAVGMVAVAATAEPEAMPTPAPTPKTAELVPRAKLVKAVRARDAARSEVRALRALRASGFTSEGNRAIARALASSLYGWTGPEADALDALWGGESGFNHLVANREGSGAYGIPQSLPGSKMASAGPDWATNPATQIVWGLRYIAKRYGSPSRALAAWRSRSPHWY